MDGAAVPGADRGAAVEGGAEASAKIRTGGPIDDAEDRAVPVWTGQLPVALRAMSHIPTPDNEPSEAPGGGDPAGLAGGAGGNAPRGIDAPRFEPPARPRGVDGGAATAALCAMDLAGITAAVRGEPT